MSEPQFEKPKMISLGGAVKIEPAKVILPPVVPEKPLTPEAAACKGLAYLLQLQAQAMAFAGKKGYNPFIWLKEKGVLRLIKVLKRNPNDQAALDEAITIEFEEPRTELFEHLYEPPTHTSVR